MNKTFSLLKVFWKSQKLIDVSANIYDTRFKGIYAKEERHTPDYENIMERA